MFVSGNTDFPLIIGGGEHPFSRQYRKGAGKDPESLKKKGIEDIQELNGLEFSINDKGDYCIENVGRKDIKQDGAIIDEYAVGGKITFYGNEKDMKKTRNEVAKSYKECKKGISVEYDDIKDK